jgi:hypothetical protein|tara:strand:- start:310 stop:531 length:222 start_codon:yes stop_codon:yes gene_type:complete
LKRCKFIRAGNNIYVPPASNWQEGWNRQRWLERHFKNPERILVTSPDSWAFLSTDNKINVLIEKSNEFIEEDS